MYGGVDGDPDALAAVSTAACALEPAELVGLSAVRRSRVPDLDLLAQGPKQVRDLVRAVCLAARGNPRTRRTDRRHGSLPHLVPTTAHGAHSAPHRRVPAGRTAGRAGGRRRRQRGHGLPPHRRTDREPGFARPGEGQGRPSRPRLDSHHPARGHRRAGRAPPRAVPAPAVDADDGFGRGLLPVASLADARGCEPYPPGGKTVWAECARRAPLRTSPGSPSGPGTRSASR